MAKHLIDIVAKKTSMHFEEYRLLSRWLDPNEWYIG